MLKIIKSIPDFTMLVLACFTLVVEIVVIVTCACLHCDDNYSMLTPFCHHPHLVIVFCGSHCIQEKVTVAIGNM